MAGLHEVLAWTAVAAEEELVIEGLEILATLP